MFSVLRFFEWQGLVPFARIFPPSVSMSMYFYLQDFRSAKPTFVGLLRNLRVLQLAATFLAISWLPTVKADCYIDV